MTAPSIRCAISARVSARKVGERLAEEPPGHDDGVVLKGLAHEQDQVVARYVLSTMCQKGDEEGSLRAKKALPLPPNSEHH
jgi:hypothetical protein